MSVVDDQQKLDFQLVSIVSRPLVKASASPLVSVAGTSCSEESAIVLSETMLTFSHIDQNTYSPKWL